MKQKGIRILAGIVDLVFGALLCFFLAYFLGYYFATRAVVMLAIGDPSSAWKGTIPMLFGVFGNYVYTLPLAWALIFLPEPIWGRSLGKLLIPVGDSILSARWIYFTWKTSGFWMMVLALILGEWRLALFGIILSGIFFSVFLVCPSHIRRHPVEPS